MRLSTLLGPELKALISESPDQLRNVLEDIHPEDLADLFGDLDGAESVAVLRAIPARQSAPVFERLDDYEQIEAATLLQLEKLAYIASAMALGRRAHLIRILPEDLSRALLEELRAKVPEAAAELQFMNSWKSGTAGYLMTTTFVTLLPTNTIAEAREALRQHHEQTHEAIDDVYILDQKGRLAGKMALREIVFAEPSRRLVDLYQRKVISVLPHEEQREVARRMAKNDLHVVPVVDAEGTLLGMVSIDDVLDALTKETTREVQRIGAVEPLDVPYFQTSFLSFIRKRGVWLVVLFAEEFFTQTALRYYDPVFEAIKGAAYYVPLLISTGGNSGSQSSTLVIRGLAVGEIRPRDWWRILFREAAMGLTLGIGLGAFGFVRVLMYPDQHVPFALTVGFTLVGIVFAGCTVGSMLPLLLKKCGVDPATSSTPFIASLVDVLGILVFVHVAKIIMANVIQAHTMTLKP